MNHNLNLFWGFNAADPANVQYRQNEVTPVDYLEFKHHSYSQMIAVSILVTTVGKMMCWHEKKHGPDWFPSF